MSRLLLASLGVLALAAAAWWSWPRLPERHNPWAPLAFDAPPNWLTRHKLARLDQQPHACKAFLATTPLAFSALADNEDAGGCVLRNAVRVRATAVRIGEPLTLSCRAAASLALWERHVLQPAAERELGAPLQQLQHAGSLACRNVYGRADGRRSQHASADAVDIAGFVLRGGRRISVARHWTAGDGAEARFLRAVHGGACGWFDGVLGPDYNRAHADHFHLDRGPYRVCR